MSASGSTPRQRALGDRIAAADQVGRRTSEQADRRADQAGARLHRPAGEPVSGETMVASSVRL